MKKILGVLGAIASFAVLLIAITIGKIGGRAAADSMMQPSKKELLVAVVEKMKGKLPMMADAETRLDSATASTDGETLSYSYTFINWRAAQISAVDLNNLKNQVINKTCANKDKTLLGKGFSLEFRYQSSDGVPLQDFIVGPSKCIYDPYAKAYGLAP